MLFRFCVYYATADELSQKENIPNNDFHKKANKENDIHTQNISKELEEKTVWKYWKYLYVKFRIKNRKFLLGVWCLGHSNAVGNYSPGRNLYLLSPINI